MSCEKLAEYINRELATRMNDDDERINFSRKDYNAVRSLLRCARGKGDDFESLRDDRNTSQVMRVLGLWSFRDLTDWAEKVTATANILVNLQAGNYDTVTSNDYEGVRHLHGGLTLLAVMNEFAYTCGHFPLRHELLALLEVVHPHYRKQLYTTLLDAILPDTTTNTLDELRAGPAVIDVLARMNSPEAGMLIDQFAKSEQTLKQLSSAGYQIPPELASVPLCVRLFMQTMRNVFTVSPLHTIGETLALTLEDSGSYDYTGSDFEDSDEAKTVRVISPGWKCGDEVFSRPKVIEVMGNAG